MISIQDAFLKFKSRLELTQREQEDASRQQKRIRELLREGFDVERDVLTGSYARHTKTKPLKDIDVFCVLAEGGGYRGAHPSKLLEAFRKVLAREYGNPQVTLQRRSVQVDLGVTAVDDDADERVMSFDVVPALTAGSHYEIPDTKLGGWVKTDPELHKDLATKSNMAFSQHWVPIVKMAKKWNEAYGKPVTPSFLVEVMAMQIFVPPFWGGYPYELKSFFATAAERISEAWPDPAGLGPPVSDQMDAPKVAKARAAFLGAEETASHALRLAREGRNGDALREWRRLFGPLFPLS